MQLSAMLVELFLISLLSVDPHGIIAKVFEYSVPIFHRMRFNHMNVDDLNDCPQKGHLLRWLSRLCELIRCSDDRDFSY